MAAKRVFSNDLLYVLVHSDIDLKGGKRTLQMPLTMSEKFRNVPITAADLSVRASNALQRHGVEKVATVIAYFDCLNKIKSCGDKTIREIKNKSLQCWYESLTPEEVVSFWEEFIDMNS